MRRSERVPPSRPGHLPQGGLLLCTLLLCSACVVGNGIEASEARAHSGFTGVAIGSFADTTITLADDFEVLITCDSDLLDFFLSRVENDVLIVRHEQILGSRLACRIDIEMPELHSMRNEGSGDMHTDDLLVGIEAIANTGSGHLRVPGAELVGGAIDLDNTGSGSLDVRGLDADLLRASVTGSGNMTLAGVAPVADYLNSGSGTLDAADLLAEDVVITCSGSGDVLAFSSGVVEVLVTGSGDVVVYGSPIEAIETDTGSGTISYP